jgi:hypothetical protein
VLLIDRSSPFILGIITSVQSVIKRRKPFYTRLTKPYRII